MPPAGHIGCVAEVTETQALPDGRSNVLAVGVVRYRVEEYVERGDSYLVVRASYFDCRRAEQELGWRATTDLASGLAQLVRWRRATAR